MELTQARELADQWVSVLQDACERIEIAGSVRRQKPECHDIELVAVPKMTRDRDMFGTVTGHHSALDDVIGIMEGEGSIQVLKGGSKYKQIALPERVNIDLFIVTPPAQFGVIYLIRTGPFEFSKWMVTPKSKGGALPSNYVVKDGAVWVTEPGRPGMIRLDMPEEIHFSNLCDLLWIEPQDRQPRWGKLP